MANDISRHISITSGHLLNQDCRSIPNECLFHHVRGTEETGDADDEQEREQQGLTWIQEDEWCEQRGKT